MIQSSGMNRYDDAGRNTERANRGKFQDEASDCGSRFRKSENDEEHESPLESVEQVKFSYSYTTSLSL